MEFVAGQSPRTRAAACASLTAPGSCPDHVRLHSEIYLTSESRTRHLARIDQQFMPGLLAPPPGRPATMSRQQGSLTASLLSPPPPPLRLIFASQLHSASHVRSLTDFDTSSSSCYVFVQIDPTELW